MAVIPSNSYNVLIDEDPTILASFVEQMKPTKIFVIVDNNTKEHCLPLLEAQLKTPFTCIQIMAGEIYKNLKTCTLIWDALIKNACDRKSLVIDLGGGVIGDMGGFVASTYMRGIPFIQIPTTLLSQVDASVGGKLGIDFLGFKNMIGVFKDPQMVWIQSQFLNTLSKRELRSGFAEVIKHGLIKSSELWNNVNTIDLNENDQINWKYILESSIQIKNDVVLEDPFEKGLRKILNFGHTVGHAIETAFLNTEQPLLHGEAIAIGMICESYISYKEGLLSGPELKEIREFIDVFYPLEIVLKPFENEVLSHIKKDKKNEGGEVRCSLLKSIGHCIYDQKIGNSLVQESLRYYDNK